MGITSSLNNYLIFINAGDILMWTNLAKNLALITKPSIYDIELCLVNALSFKSSSVISLNHAKHDVPKNEEVKLPKKEVEIKLTNKTKIKETLKSGQSIEIDGVKFSYDESLTSIDSKITPGRGPETIVEPTLVELDKHKIPMSDQEFSRAFIESLSR